MRNLTVFHRIRAVCSIIGYSGITDAAPLLVEGLKRMEYRGYDSAGVATLRNGLVDMKKGVGKVAEVDTALDLASLSGKIGIGHTRWATHGKVSETNAHPHPSWSNEIAIVHNGIIDNYEVLKRELSNLGYHFRSETDSEIIANLLQFHFDRTKDVKASMLATVAQLKGKYSFVAMFNNGTLAAARFHEPLILGIGKEGYFVASDILGFVHHTDEVIYVDNGEIALIRPDGIYLCDFEGRPVRHNITKVSREFGSIDKKEYIHYTLKEIYEQPTTILNAGGKNDLELSWAARLIKRSRNLYITGSGTSFNAALVGKYLFSKYANIRAEPVISSEALFSPVEFDSHSILLAISQSGESADVIETVSNAREKKTEVISLVNVVTSSLVQLSSVTLGLNCGPEIGVAATKSFTSQMAILYKLADLMSGGTLRLDFDEVSTQMSKLLFDHSIVQEIAKKIKNVADIYVLGKGLHYYIASEAALKLKELAYVHAEALPGGELKHGPLALLDENAYVIVINPDDSTHESMLAAAHEVKARGSKIIGISDRNEQVYDFWIPIPTIDEALFPLIEIVPIQLLSYYLALERNANPDYPRNLAKSVTVR